MLTPNYGSIGTTFKFTCSDTVFASLVIYVSFILTIVKLSLGKHVIDEQRYRNMSITR